MTRTAVAFSIWALTSGLVPSAEAQIRRLDSANHGLGAPQSSTPARLADEYLRRLVPFGFSGAVVVVEQGRVVLEKGYGLADRGRGTEMTPDTPVLIGSVSKQFTAALAMALVDDGKLALEDSVGRFFRHAPRVLAGASVEQLLRHLGGLPYHTNRNFAEGMLRRSVLEEMLGLELARPPGAGFSYSNPGYTVVAGILERAGGAPYESLLEERLILPVGLLNTGSIFEPDRWADAARGYADGADQGGVVDYSGLDKAVGSASVVSSARDLVEWALALESAGVVSPDLTAALFTGPQAGNVSVGMGWFATTSSRGSRVLLSGGDLGPFNAEVRIYPDEGRILAAVSNVRVGGRGFREAIMNPVVLMLTGGKIELPPEVIDPDSGRSELSFANSTGSVTVRVGNGEARLLAEGVPRSFFSDPAADSREGLGVAEMTRELFDDLAAGRSSSLAAVAHPAMSWQGLARQEDSLWTGYESRGSLQDVTVKRPVALRPGVWSVEILLDLGGESVWRSATWDGGRVLELREVDKNRRGFLLRRTREGYVWYDPFSARRIDLVTRGQNGAVHLVSGDRRWTGRAPIGDQPLEDRWPDLR